MKVKLFSFLIIALLSAALSVPAPRTLTTTGLPGAMIPNTPRGTSTTPTLQTGKTLSVANDKYGVIVQAPRTGSITEISFLTGAVSVTSGPLNFDFRLETVDAATGNPSGTLVGTNTNIAVAVADTDDNAIKTGTLTAAASVTKGDYLAPVISSPGSGTFSVVIQNFADDQSKDLPYGAVHDGSSWTAKSAHGVIVLLKYSDSPTYIHAEGTWPISAVNTHTFNNTSTPDAHGLAFRLPYPARLTGCWAWIDPDGDFDFKLYSASGVTTLLSVDKDRFRATSANTMLFNFTTTVNLVKDADYVLAVEPSSATSMTLYSYDVPSAAAMGAAEGGTAFTYGNAKDPTSFASFTVTTTRRAFMGLKLDQFDDGTGGGTTIRYVYIPQ